jgi:hypothetical protein
MNLKGRAHVIDCAIKVAQLMPTVGRKHDNSALISCNEQKLQVKEEVENVANMRNHHSYG